MVAILCCGSGGGAVETRDINNGALTSEITIAHAGPEHAGEYRCLARNLYGSDELLYRLFVKGTYKFRTYTAQAFHNVYHFYID